MVNLPSPSKVTQFAALIGISVLGSRLVAPLFEEPARLVLCGSWTTYQSSLPWRNRVYPCVVPLGVIILRRTRSWRGVEWPWHTLSSNYIWKNKAPPPKHVISDIDTCQPVQWGSPQAYTQWEFRERADKYFWLVFTMVKLQGQYEG